MRQSRKASRIKSGLLAAMTAVAASTVVVGGTATPALADRCEPEELVLGANTSPIHEDDNPVCTVLFYYVYPFICAPSGDQPPPTLPQCLTSISLNPDYRPPLIPPYNPDTGRLVCNLVLFASPTTTCTFSSDPLSGATEINVAGEHLTIPGQPEETA